MNCPTCQREAREGALFCIFCGNQMPAIAPESAIGVGTDARPTSEMPSAQIEPKLPDLPPAISGSQRTATDELPRAPRLSEPSVVVNSNIFKDEHMHDDRITEDPQFADEPRFEGTDEHPVSAAMAYGAHEVDVHFADGNPSAPFVDVEEPAYEDDEYDDEYDDDEYDDWEDESQVEHHFKVSDDSDRSLELESILAQLQDDNVDETGRAGSASIGGETAPDGKRKGEPSFVDDDQAFRMGDASFIDDDREIEFVFGDDDDSGPIPLTSAEYEARTNPGIEDEEAAKPGRIGDFFDVAKQRVAELKDKARNFEMAKFKRTSGRRKQGGGGPEKRQIVIAIIAMLVVFGVGYAVFGGDDAADTADAGGDEAAVEEVAEAAETETPDYELVRLGEGDESAVVLDDDVAMNFDDVDDVPGATGGAAQPTPAPTGAPVDAKYQEQNILTSATNQGKVHTLTRACVLRKGPASRFEMIQPLNPGDKLTVLANSSEDWETVTANGVSGWTKDCQGDQCPVYMGPGKHFRKAWKGDDTPKPTRRVVSSARWSYVSYGKLYGWTGPACFKP